MYNFNNNLILKSAGLLKYDYDTTLNNNNDIQKFYYWT